MSIKNYMAALTEDRPPGSYSLCAVSEPAQPRKIYVLEKEHNHMFNKTSEGENQKTNYMAQLDEWTDEQVIKPLFEAWEFQEKAHDDESAKLAAQEVEEAVKDVHKAIREKVLESYRNGLKAKDSRPSRSGAARRQYGAR
jgi:hypothetical protein